MNDIDRDETSFEEWQRETELEIAPKKYTNSYFSIPLALELSKTHRITATPETP